MFLYTVIIKQQQHRQQRGRQAMNRRFVACRPRCGGNVVFFQAESIRYWLLLLVQMQEEMTMTYQAASSSSSSSAAANVCYRYAIVRDVAAQTDIDVCSSLERVSHAYTSVGRSLEIRLFRQRIPGNQSSPVYSSSIPPAAGPFLLHYTGTLLY